MQRQVAAARASSRSGRRSGARRWRNSTAIPNADGLLWKIEKAGSAPSWLFGTMHVPDPRVTSLKEPVAEAFAAAKVVVLESTELTTDRDSQLALDMLELAQLPEGETFDAGFTAAEKDALGKLTAARGIPYFAARKLKPWFVAVSISIPACAQIAMMRGRARAGREAADRRRRGGQGADRAGDGRRAARSDPGPGRGDRSRLARRAGPLGPGGRRGLVHHDDRSLRPGAAGLRASADGAHAGPCRHGARRRRTCSRR